ncbi:MAG: AlpA family phage regulatory protein [Proteobacteria bacterium]|nr:AlpA family phage regulatory protein [Pseudomonadota bacterium]
MSHSPKTYQPKVILRLPKVLEKTVISRASLYVYLKDNRFPAAIKISDRCVGWLEHEIDQWIESRMALRG